MGEKTLPFFSPEKHAKNMALGKMDREISQCKSPKHAKNNVWLPLCRSSTVCQPSLVQVCVSLARFYRSNCCYSVRKSMLKTCKVLGAKPLTGLWELKDSRGKLLTREGIKPHGKTVMNWRSATQQQGRSTHSQHD